jgi:hypothetical protein
MPLFRGGRPLKRWRYVGVYGRDLMLCAGTVRVGPTRQCFWAVWDREAGILRERTRFVRTGNVRFEEGWVNVRDGDVLIDLELDLDDGNAVEVVSPHGAQHIWTRKHGGVRANGAVLVGDRTHRVDGRALVDESAGYHARRTAWEWSAGVGVAADGRPVAWNLVDGVHDGPEVSERTVWVNGEPGEIAPVHFAPDLSAIHGAAGEELRFEHQAERRRHDNLLLFRSVYRQPFGRFSGTLPGGIELAEGYGVMEEHDVRW